MSTVYYKVLIRTINKLYKLRKCSNTNQLQTINIIIFLDHLINLLFLLKFYTYVVKIFVCIDYI